MKADAKLLFLILLFGFMATLGGCKKAEKDQMSEELIIQLQPGTLHVQTQWIGDTLWVESFDPKTNACLLRHYGLDGTIIESSPKIRLKGCRLHIAPPKNDSQLQAAQTKPPVKQTIKSN